MPSRIHVHGVLDQAMMGRGFEELASTANSPNSLTKSVKRAAGESGRDIAE